MLFTVSVLKPNAILFRILQEFRGEIEQTEAGGDENSCPLMTEVGAKRP